MLRDALKDRGCHVIAAQNLNELQAIIQAHPLDLFIIDTACNDEACTEAIGFLRQLQEQCLLPILVIVEAPDKDEKIKVLALGADRYLEQSCMREIVTEIAALLRMRRNSYAEAISAFVPAIENRPGTLLFDV